MREQRDSRACRPPLAAGYGIGRALTSLGAMRQEVIWDHEAARRYDTPGTGMLAPRVLGPAVGRIAQLASDGRAQESAIGAGRVAIPWLGAACLSRASSYPA